MLVHERDIELVSRGVATASDFQAEPDVPAVQGVGMAVDQSPEKKP